MEKESSRLQIRIAGRSDGRSEVIAEAVKKVKASSEGGV